MNAPIVPTGSKSDPQRDGSSNAVYAAKTADRGLDGGRGAREALNALSDDVASAKSHVMPALHEAASNAEDLARTGVKAVQDKAMSLRATSEQYIRERPMQALLIAAGTGAALMVLLRLFSSSSR